ncbi:MAG: conjugal transfer protein TraH, partial [Nitratireductor sp.]
MIDIDLIQQCADPRLEIAVVQQFVAEISAPDHLAIRVFQGD